MLVDLGMDELERGGPSEGIILIVGIAMACALIYRLAQIAEDAIKCGKWGYTKAVLELGFFPGAYFAVTEIGAWIILASPVWCFAYFFAEEKATRAKKARAGVPKRYL